MNINRYDLKRCHHRDIYATAVVLLGKRVYLKGTRKKDWLGRISWMLTWIMQCEYKFHFSHKKRLRKKKTTQKNLRICDSNNRWKKKNDKKDGKKLERKKAE